AARWQPQVLSPQPCANRPQFAPYLIGVASPVQHGPVREGMRALCHEFGGDQAVDELGARSSVSAAAGVGGRLSAAGPAHTDAAAGGGGGDPVLPPVKLVGVAERLLPSEGG